MEWLRIQLQILRDRGMKAILMGHVPPARVGSKESWDETCWQKYTLWNRQFRDVIVGGLYGHMNIDHFMLQDFDQISKDAEKGRMASGSRMGKLEEEGGIPLYEDGEVTVASASDYLLDLREAWAQLPAPPKAHKKSRKTMAMEDEEEISTLEWLAVMMRNGKSNKADKKKYLDMIGGKFAERYSVTHVAPSVVPNYYPTLRIIEYNITGLESNHVFTSGSSSTPESASPRQQPLVNIEDFDDNDEEYSQDVESAMKKKHKNKKPRKYKFRVPEGPSKSSPPGPAYSPQTFTWTRFTQYFANLTHINNDFVENNGTDTDTISLNEDSPTTIFGLNVTADGQIDSSGWKEGKHGKHQGKQPRPEPHPNEFVYEIEYDTKTNRKFPDLTVRRWVEYARRIGQTGIKAADVEDLEDHEDAADVDLVSQADADQEEKEDDVDDMGKKHKKKKGKKKKHHKASKEWYTFVRRAFVGTMNPHEIKQLFSVGPVAETVQEKEEIMDL
jgi:endopolyphosphatase